MHVEKLTVLNKNEGKEMPKPAVSEKLTGNKILCIRHEQMT